MTEDNKPEQVVVKRDFDALLVPSAMPILVLAGTTVTITQYKGGSATIYINGNLARVDSKDLDAIGIEADPNDLEERLTAKQQVATGPVDVDQVWAQLKTCYDPEIPVNIVDLGIVYSCKVEANEDHSSNIVHITMTLTAPGCNMGPVLINDMENKVMLVENVTEVKIEMVFDPPWSQDMMSDEAKLKLGLL